MHQYYKKQHILFTHLQKKINIKIIIIAFITAVDTKIHEKLFGNFIKMFFFYN